MSSAAIDIIAASQRNMRAKSAPVYATPLAATAPLAFEDAPFSSYPVSSHEITEADINELKNQGYTEGLARALSVNSDEFPIRFWVIDNSGSMNKPDGHRIVETTKQNDVKIVSCTRWEELKEGVIYHAQLASLLGAHTVFRLLNNPGSRVGQQEFTVEAQNDYHAARSLMNKSQPSGLTPLNDHILYIHERIRSMSPSLEKDGKKAVVVLTTDGLPTDEMGLSSEYASKQFVQSLSLLEGLPVWVVIRLCTDDDKVVSFYNNVDEQLELSIDVLDDIEAEAKEVQECGNSWLNYALPLHRIREFGFHDRVFDLIDERRLTTSELRKFCLILFGEAEFDGVPDPGVDWMGFLNEIERMLRKEKGQWNPLKKKVLPWIDTRELNRLYGKSACASGCVIQ